MATRLPIMTLSEAIAIMHFPVKKLSPELRQRIYSLNQNLLQSYGIKIPVLLEALKIDHVTVFRLIY